MASMVNEAKKALSASQEHVQYFEKKLAQLFIQMLAKDAKAVN